MQLARHWTVVKFLCSLMGHLVRNGRCSGLADIGNVQAPSCPQQRVECWMYGLVAFNRILYEKGQCLDT